MRHDQRQRTFCVSSLARPTAIFVRAMLSSFIAVAVLACDGRLHGQQTETRLRFSLGDVSFPEGLVNACPLERTPLSVKELASNREHSPLKARQVEDGWLVYDRYDRQVIELSSDLRLVARWGRIGEGPMEYRATRRGPSGFGRTEGGETFVVDDAPPSIMTLGLHRNEYQLRRGRGEAIFIDDAINVDNRIFMATRKGILESTLGKRSFAARWDLEDMDIVVSEHGQGPKFLLRHGLDGKLYAGASNQSYIWALDDGPSPRKVVQRCLPEGLMNVFTDAPRLQGGIVDGMRFSTTTTIDFLVLPTGHTLALGALEVNADKHQSIEMYDRNGTLLRAWTLPLAGVRGTFDPRNPRRILIWDGEDEHVKLIEIDGQGYPTS